MNIINKEDVIASNDFCSKCGEKKGIKIVSVANNYIELCEKCRKKLIDMLERTV